MREYLSHYTNVDSLEKILQNQSIKFNALKNLNDKNEGRNKEGFPTQNMMYSSSWCDDNSVDGIKYMWDNYTKEGSGIRITMQKYPFKKYKYISKNFKNEMGEDLYVYLQPNLHTTFIEDYLHKLLYKVKYTDDKEEYLPSVMSYDSCWNNINTNKLGICKETKWETENEWRYLISILHRGLIGVDDKHLKLAIELAYPNEIFLKIRYSCIKHMNILMEKNMNEDNIKKLIELQKKYRFKIENK